MKLIKTITIITFILILLEGFAYFNIMTSEKYEVDLLETTYKIQEKRLPQESIETKKREILAQKKRTKAELMVLTIVFVSLVSVWAYKSHKAKVQH